MLRLSREALPMRRGSYRVQRLSVKRNTSQTDQAGKYFLLTFARALFGWAGFSWWWCTQGIFLHWLLHIYI